MTQYDELKKTHAQCKEKMSSRDWKRFSLGNVDRCPICKQEKEE